MNSVAIRLLNQQLAAPQFGDPAEVVGHFGAMQAQEYRMMRWAVAMRTRKPSAAAFKAAYDSGRIIRLHLMRGTWQLVTAEDYWSMITLCAPRSIAVTRGWMNSNKIHITEEEITTVRDILAQTAADKGSVTKEDFVQALAEKDISMDAHRLSYHIRMAEMTGTLCSGDLLPMKATYALTANKVKPAGTIYTDEVLMNFTRKYFQSHQPATLQDFAWWSGLSINLPQRHQVAGKCNSHREMERPRVLPHRRLPHARFPQGQISPDSALRRIPHRLQEPRYRPRA